MANATLERSPVKVERLPSPPPGVTPYTPHGAAADLWTCKAKEVLIEGPTRTGKTRSALAKIDFFATQAPGFRALVARNTRESMSQSVMETFEHDVLPDPGAAPFNHEDSEYRYPNGSKVVVVGLDKPSKALSTEYDMIFICQAEETTEEQVDPLLTRLSGHAMEKAFGAGYRQAIYDVNPSDPQHWLNLRFPPADQPTRDRVRLVTGHKDNPLFWDHARGEWTAIGRDYMKTLDLLTGYRRLRLRDGLWAGAEGQFFEEWDPDLHICEPFEIPDHWTRWVGSDYGYAEPCCHLWFARDPSPDEWGRRRIYLYRELYRRGLRDAQQALEVRRLSRGERIVKRYADPSMFNKRSEQGKPSIAQVFQAARVPLTRSSNNRIVGWQVCRKVLAHDEGRPPLFQVFRGAAPNFCRTLPVMVCDPLDPEDLADKVRGVKTEDHACLVGSTLVLTERGERMIKSIVVGDRVWTRQGWQRVTHWALTQLSAPIYRVQFSDGPSLAGTNDHPVWVQGKGFTPIDRLSYGDIVQTINPSLLHAVPVPVRSVIAVESAGNAPVYNITVENAHEYFAQGVLVSNCDGWRYGMVGALSARLKVTAEEVRFGYRSAA